VHISRLRAAIEKDKENPKYIVTVRGIGYKFADLK
jgi:DNA-binding response OmpR family regulator